MGVHSSSQQPYLVDHIRQEKPNSCWHASARMLYGFWNQACINPLPADYDADQGLTAQQFIDLASNLGLSTLPRVNQSYGWTWMRDALNSYGPIWAAGQWNGPNHIVVITGVDSDGTLYVNDPAYPSPVIRNMGWFNQKIDKNVDIPMMYLAQ
ncbi:Papain-like cysteine protease AvrRpt2 [Aquisphaera giovannonii]|uniref:Papain-like cysteine protease AvrRpt2 n=1 Tax=Aquisphaera giovannonii TaxID=406548 RepID=A0A5B9VXA9_9BACT|nr:papain-like cysteine protease family protein [Aquisphaera giovannonii]QEH32415.1 Papain-like cysteine protease AvrRpt2 [Aquisphaera giovannonii]